MMYSARKIMQKSLLTDHEGTDKGSQQKKLETDTISSIEGLQSVGILLDTDIYIPENFMLGKDGVTFYYNRYEIAPYSAGDFSLTVPYDDINVYLK